MHYARARGGRNLKWHDFLLKGVCPIVMAFRKKLGAPTRMKNPEALNFKIMGLQNATPFSPPTKRSNEEPRQLVAVFFIALLFTS